MDTLQSELRAQICALLASDQALVLRVNWHIKQVNGLAVISLTKHQRL
jgi:hypothetical protein